MSGKVFAVASIATTAAAAQVVPPVGPWGEVLSAQTAVVALFGAMGGASRWLFLKEPWLEGARLTLLGMLLGVGLGQVALPLLRLYFNLDDASIWSQPVASHASAYLIGLMSVTVLGWLFDLRKTGGGHDQ